VALAGAAFASSSPDTELIQAIARWREAEAAHDAAVEAARAAEERYEDPAIPEVLYRRDGDRTFRIPPAIATDRTTGQRYYDTNAVLLLRQSPRKRDVQRRLTEREIAASLDPSYDLVSAKEVWPEAQARADEIIAAGDWLQGERQRREDAAGIRVAEETERGAYQAYRAAGRAIADTPATTVQGAILKARVVAEWYGNDVAEIAEGIGRAASHAEQVALSVVRDLLVLNGVAAAEAPLSGGTDPEHPSVRAGS
jgi:hypothetical protein